MISFCHNNADIHSNYMIDELDVLSIIYFASDSAYTEAGWSIERRSWRYGFPVLEHGRIEEEG